MEHDVHETAFVEPSSNRVRAAAKILFAELVMATADSRGKKGAFQADLMLSFDRDHHAASLIRCCFRPARRRMTTDCGWAASSQFRDGLVFITLPVSEDTSIETYFAPIGDPALVGCVSPSSLAMELPQATLAHHLQGLDTHSYEVARWHRAQAVQVEASGFHGRSR